MHIFRSTLAFSLLLASLSACVQTTVVNKPPLGLTPENPQAQQTSLVLARSQTEQLVAQSKAMSGPKLWFAGFGFHSGSKAFRGDVLLTERRLRAQYPQTLAFMFDNALHTENIETPFAHLGALSDTVKEIAHQVKKGDVVTIMLSTHGYTRLLATQIGGRDYASIMDYHLATALAPLKDVPTILIISACYSGSLIPALKNENRIILTASAETKVSYGCQPLAQNTFFIDALFGEQHDATHSLINEFNLARGRIAIREKEKKLDASDPQIFIGEKMKDLAAKPMYAWLTSTIKNTTNSAP